MTRYGGRDYVATATHATTRTQPRTTYGCDSTTDVGSYRYGHDSYERARQAVEDARRELEERRKHANNGPSPYSFVTQAPRQGAQSAVTQAPRAASIGYNTPRNYSLPRKDENDAAGPYGAVTQAPQARWGTDSSRTGYHTPRQTKTTHDYINRNTEKLVDDNTPTRLSAGGKSFTDTIHKPLTTRRRKTLVIDLDETLVHSCFDPCSCDLRVLMTMDDVRYTAYVKKRPGCDEFLRAAAKQFEVIIWTASLDCYAKPVIDELERESGCGKLRRMYRESCSRVGGSFIKDLSTIGRTLSEVAIVDNTPGVASKQPRNLVEVTSWYEDKTDRELFKLVEGFEHLSNCDSVYDVIRRRGVHY